MVTMSRLLDNVFVTVKSIITNVNLLLYLVSRLPPIFHLMISRMTQLLCHGEEKQQNVTQCRQRYCKTFETKIKKKNDNFDKSNHILSYHSNVWDLN